MDQASPLEMGTLHPAIRSAVMIKLDKMCISLSEQHNPCNSAQPNMEN